MRGRVAVAATVVVAATIVGFFFSHSQRISEHRSHHALVLGVVNGASRVHNARHLAAERKEINCD
jgi:hypothetical protein